MLTKSLAVDIPRGSPWIILAEKFLYIHTIHHANNTKTTTKYGIKILYEKPVPFTYNINDPHNRFNTCLTILSYSLTCFQYSIIVFQTVSKLSIAVTKLSFPLQIAVSLFISKTC